MLNNTLANGPEAKRIKDQIEAELPKNASRSKIKKGDRQLHRQPIRQDPANNEISKTNRQLHKTAGFEGSPLYLFLLDELVAWTSSTYWDCRTISSTTTNRSSSTTKQVGGKPEPVPDQQELSPRVAHADENGQERSASGRLLERPTEPHYGLIQSDGSYLFNFRILGPFSYADVLLFCRALAKYRGVATVPYPTGLVRFSLGGYIAAGKEGMKIFSAEIEDAFSIFIRYWTRFAAERADEANKGVESKDLLERDVLLSERQGVHRQPHPRLPAVGAVQERQSAVAADPRRTLAVPCLSRTKRRNDHDDRTVGQLGDRAARRHRRQLQRRVRIRPQLRFHQNLRKPARTGLQESARSGRPGFQHGQLEIQQGRDSEIHHQQEDLPAEPPRTGQPGGEERHAGDPDRDGEHALLGQQDENPGDQRHRRPRTGQIETRRPERHHQEVHPRDPAPLQPAVRERESRTAAARSCAQRANPSKR